MHSEGQMEHSPSGSPEAVTSVAHHLTKGRTFGIATSEIFGETSENITRSKHTCTILFFFHPLLFTVFTPLSPPPLDLDKYTINGVDMPSTTTTTTTTGA